MRGSGRAEHKQCVMQTEPDWTNKMTYFDDLCQLENKMYIPAYANS